MKTDITISIQPTDHKCHCSRLNIKKHDNMTIKSCEVGVNLPDLPRVLAAMYAT